MKKETFLMPLQRLKPQYKNVSAAHNASKYGTYPFHGHSIPQCTAFRPALFHDAPSTAAAAACGPMPFRPFPGRNLPWASSLFSLFSFKDTMTGTGMRPCHAGRASPRPNARPASLPPRFSKKTARARPGVPAFPEVPDAADVPHSQGEPS